MNFVKNQTNKMQSKIKMIASRAIIDTVNQGLAGQNLKIQVYADEVLDEVSHYQEYGLASKPLKGCRAVTLFLGANRENGVVIATDDDSRPADLEDGDVCLYTSQGAKILIKNADGKINITTDSEVNITSPVVNAVSDNIKLGSGTVEKLLKGETFQTFFNAHTHTGNLGAPTSTPIVPSDVAQLCEHTKGS